jgi:hypothetical protein
MIRSSLAYRCAIPLVLSLLVPAILACAAPAGEGGDSLRTLYGEGQPFPEFLASAQARRPMWDSNYSRGWIDPALLARARAIPGRWHLLVVSMDSCSDSANTIPYLASLVDSLGGQVDLRIVSPAAGRRVMEEHRTWDRRGATPTVVLLDDSWEERGCWVERPGPLAAWTRQQEPRLSHQEFVQQKIEWYERDQGRETVREIVEMMEQAGPGRACGGNAE